MGNEIKVGCYKVTLGLNKYDGGDGKKNMVSYRIALCRSNFSTMWGKFGLDRFGIWRGINGCLEFTRLYSKIILV